MRLAGLHTCDGRTRFSFGAGLEEVTRKIASEPSSPLDALRTPKGRQWGPLGTMVVSGVTTFTVSSAIVFVGDGQACLEVAQHVIQRLLASPRFTRVACVSQGGAIARQEWAKDLTAKLACSFDSVEDVVGKIEEAGGEFDTALVLLGATREEGGMLWGGSESGLSRIQVWQTCFKTSLLMPF
jgi:hypothetical protein